MTKTRSKLMQGTAVSAALALVILAPLIGWAQDFETTPDTDDLMDGLDTPRAAFRVSVPSDVDDDLIELGRLVAMGGAKEGDAAMACFSCHGAGGVGDGSGAFPRLSGQPGWYLYKQLQDYASGDRPNRVMSAIAKRLTAKEMEGVAAYYAAIEASYMPVIGDIDAETLQWGAQLGAVGSAERGIPACTNCHGPNGAGNGPSVPYLAGQYALYMQHQLQMWKDDKRDNDAQNVMSAIADKMTEEDMRAVSEYYMRVRPLPDKEMEPSYSAVMVAE